MIWPFRKKPARPIDKREWNDDWKVGDTAEVIANARWVPETPPWERLPAGAQYTVMGFSEARGRYSNDLYYFLQLEGLDCSYSTQLFRKVRTVSAEQSEVIKRILNAKPGKDVVREDA